MNINQRIIMLFISATVLASSTVTLHASQRAKREQAQREEAEKLRKLRETTTAPKKAWKVELEKQLAKIKTITLVNLGEFDNVITDAQTYVVKPGSELAKKEDQDTYVDQIKKAYDAQVGPLFQSYVKMLDLINNELTSYDKRISTSSQSELNLMNSNIKDRQDTLNEISAEINKLDEKSNTWDTLDTQITNVKKLVSETAKKINEEITKKMPKAP